jgi:hypothetical protein
MNMGFLLIGGVAAVFAVVLPTIARMFWEWYDNEKKKA